MLRGFLVLGLSLTVLAGTAYPAPTPAQRCESEKLTAQSKFTQCRLKADATYAKTLDAAKQTSAYATCQQKLAQSYLITEAKYTSACPTIGDQAAVSTYHQAATAKARDWTGGDLPKPFVFERFTATGNTLFCQGGAISNPQDVPCAGTGQDAETQTGAVLAYIDNGNGTITDLNSGLMWTKKSWDGTLHDQNNCYSWLGACSGDGDTICATDANCTVAGGTCDPSFADPSCSSDLTAFEWIEAVNEEAFAGYTDWRLPNIRELSSLIYYGGGYELIFPTFFLAPCSPGCTVTSCSCGGASVGRSYWSSSARQTNASPYMSWIVNFQGGNGGANEVSWDFPAHVRAVRGGS